MKIFISLYFRYPSFIPVNRKEKKNPSMNYKIQTQILVR